MKLRTTEIPFRDWPWRARVVEKLYRLTHGGRIRTLVIRESDRWPPERILAAAVDAYNRRMNEFNRRGDPDSTGSA